MIDRQLHLATARWWEIGGVVTLPFHRGRGLGSRVVRTALAELAEALLVRRNRSTQSAELPTLSPAPRIAKAATSLLARRATIGLRPSSIPCI